MGRDKALLPWRSRSFLEHVAIQVKAAAGNVALIGDPQSYVGFGYPCFPDRRMGMGPLAGIEVALESGRGELNLIVACDMPGLQAAWLIQLLEEAQKTGAQCVAARDANGRIHPLCASYRSSCLPAVQRALDDGHLKLLDLLEKLKAVTLDIGATIWNINTPEEWSAWQGAAADD